MNKYNNTPVSHAGRSFASKAEASLFDYLYTWQQTGEIQDVRQQVHVKLTNARIVYIADFRYTLTKTNEFVWAEMKGFETDVWKIKKRLWRHYGPGLLAVYKKRGPKLYLDEEIFPELSLPAL